MDFPSAFFSANSMAYAILVLSLVIATGLLLGNMRIFGLQLGITGVLFSGIIFGHFHITFSSAVLEFIREFGLIIFVYTVGVQVGPGFFSSLKKDGLSLNLMAAAIVILGVAVTAIIYLVTDIPLPAVAGMFSGATTNTPSLAAAQQMFKEMSAAGDIHKIPALSYAISYPFGILGIILTMVFLRIFFRIDVAKEAGPSLLDSSKVHSPETISLTVENKNLDGLAIKNIPAVNETGVVISRISHKSEVKVPLPHTKVHVGDILQVVGSREKLDRFRLIIGSESSVDLRTLKSGISVQKVILTRREIVGKTLQELNVRDRYGVTVTRISRSDIEFAATPDIKLRFADVLMIVGEEKAMKEFAFEAGNSAKELDYPHLVPVFMGIAIGIILGSWPIILPGVSVPIKLGLAGGPLIAAIVLSRIGRLGPFVWYMPTSSNFMLRELGIALFLACVGLKAGEQFLATLLSGNGFYWMAWASLITLVPIMTVSLFARWKFKLNYFALCGLLAGSMTDPPALAFASNISGSNAPSVAYATVYPLVMILRIVSVQILILFLQ